MRQLGSEHYDLVVGGGGSQAGARALLLDAAGCLAGAATLKCVQIYSGSAQSRTGSVPPWPVWHAAGFDDAVGLISQPGDTSE